jgi:hypothetical protein
MKSFRDLLHSIARRTEQFIDNAVNATVSANFTDLINSAYRAAWNFYPWPDAMELREEAVIAHPTVSGAVYVPRVTAVRELSTVFTVWSDDPRKKDTKAVRIQVMKRNDGLYFYESITPVWVDYRPVAPQFTDTAWSDATTYEADALVLFTDGHVYKSLQGTNLNKSPDTETAWWVKQGILESLYEATKQGVISHYKRYQSGQPVTAKTFDELMQADLEREIFRLQLQEQQTRSY